MIRNALPLGATLALCLPGIAIGWQLSGKVRDAEEGNGLKSVEVSLAVAGLRTTTAKNGDWTLEGVSSVHRPAGLGPLHRDGIALEDGRIRLRLDGHDHRGRRVSATPGTSAASPSGTRSEGGPPLPGLRAEQAAWDTLVLARDGYTPRRIPLASPIGDPREDSIRRIRYEGWVDSSHANRKADTLDGFTRGFRTVTFRWSKESWNAMMKAMADSCGKFGTKAGGYAGGTSRNCRDGQYDLIEKTALVWVPADLETDGQVWRNVGIRLKGNASLQTAWTSGNHALPFRINTDKFEDSLPTTRNQRFHGFQKISFYNGQQDSTGIRGPVAGEIFRQFGVPAPLSVPVNVVLKFGDTTKKVGIYEMVEVPDEPFLSRNFGNDSGNLYKPLSKLDKFVDSEWVDEDVPGDRSDARALIDVINSTRRTTDSASWHRALEKALDVQAFLRWLAASTAIMNWDAYGNLAHNYYLFNDSGTFRFVTYDFGWSFDYQMASIGIVSRTSVWYDGTAGGVMNLGPFPLVKNLLADRSYCESYRKYLTEVVAGPASAASFQAKVDKYASWVASADPATDRIKALRGFMTQRIPEIQASLAAKACPIQ